jgi:hypothetical protein
VDESEFEQAGTAEHPRSLGLWARLRNWLGRQR